MKKVILLLTPFLFLATSFFQLNRNPIVDQIQEDLHFFSNQVEEEQVYLHLDRTFYRPGETIWFSAYIRGMNSRKAENTSEIVKVELYKPNGTIQSSVELLCIEGNCTSGIVLPRDNGGVYTIKAFTSWQENSESFFEKEIQVQQVLLPNLNMKLDFEKKAYGANDMVVAELELEKLNNQPLKYVGFTYKVHLGGSQYLEKQGRTNFEGKTKLYFNLPDSLKSSDGILNVIIPHQGLIESISRSVPIVLNNIDLAFFPEGGDIINGQTTNVAFEALNEFGKPADIKGILEDSKGNKISSFSSLHNGMGKFKLHAKQNEKYFVRITKPEGIKKHYQLPLAKADGLTLNVDEVHERYLDVSVQGNSRSYTNLHLIAQSGDSIYFDRTFKPGEQKDIRIDTRDFPIGISRLTVFDNYKIPLAERLVFLNKHKKLNIEIETDKEIYMPREKVEVKIKVTDENGKGIKGNFSMSASDNKLLTYADDKQGHILSKVLLEHELKGEIIEPNFYFDEDEADADAALDLLMMTHGWRRFEWEPVFDKKELALKHAKQQMQLAGRVLDKFGEPIEGALVKVSSHAQSDSTDADGYFKISGVHLSYNGAYLMAYKDGLEISRKGVNDYRNDYMLTSFNLKANFKGYVYGKKDQICRNCKFNLRNEEGREMSYTTDKEGAFAIYNLNSGPYIIDLLGKKDITEGSIKVTIEAASNNISNLHFAKKETIDALAQAKEQELENLLEPASIVKSKTDPLKPLDVNVATTSKQPETAVVSDDNLAGKTSLVSIRSGESLELSEVVVVGYSVPLISQDNTSTGGTLTSDQIRNMPTRNITALAASTAGLSQIDEGEPIHIKGSRANATDYYIDGIRVRANGSLIPQSEVEQLQVITGGIEAQYGGWESTSLPEEKRKDNKLALDLQPDMAYEADRQTMQQANFNRTLSRNSGPVYYSGHRYWRYKRPNKIRNLATSNPAKTFIACDPNAKNKNLHCLETEMINHIKKRVNDYGYYIYNYKSEIANVEFVVDKKGCVGDIKLKFDDPEDERKNNWVFTNSVTYLNSILPYQKKKLKPGTRYSVQLHLNEMSKRGAVKYYNTRHFYSRSYYQNYKVKVRSDFRSTVYWNGNVVTNNEGEAKYTFWNGDDITNYVIAVEGFGKDGSVGRGETSYAIQAPFSIISKIPHAFASLDTMQLPVTLINNTDEPQSGKLLVNAPVFCHLLTDLDASYELAPQSTKSIFLKFAINDISRYWYGGRINVSFETKDYYDAFNKPVKLIKRGYPHHYTYTDVNLENEFNFEIKEPYPGSVQANFKAHPNPVSEAAACMEKIIRQPNGCFEQTSSSNYPNLLAIQLMKKSGIYNAEIQQRANKYLKSGYDRLSGYETPGGGFSLYGRSPGAARLSAYGLMQFHDMASVYPVEQDLLDRTAKWLMKNRDGKGGWNNSYYPQLNAYILWAMCEAGYGDKLEKEIDVQYEKITKNNDPYQVALMCNVLLLTEDERAEPLLNKLINSVKSNGGWAGAKRSVTYSTGRMLSIETTALALLAFSKSKVSRPDLEQNALNFILKSRNQYGFGSTQSTILSLKAIIASMDRLDTEADESGIIDLFVNGKLIRAFNYHKDQTQGITLNEIPALQTEGKHQVEVKFRGTNKPIPFDLEVKFHSKFGQLGAGECPVKLATTWNSSTPKMGETIRLVAKIENITADTVATPLAIIGIPGGMTAQPWQLKELMDKNIVEYYEAKNDQIVFYLDHMAPKEAKVINLDLKAELPGKYQSPASQAYLYYNNEAVSWAIADPMEIRE